MKCACWRFWGMRKCACGDRIKHIVGVHHFQEIEIILCSQNMWAFIGRFDWNRLSTAELERHYLQHGCDHQHAECKCIDCVHATDCASNFRIACMVQIPVAPPSWTVYVRYGSCFGWWLWFDRQVATDWHFDDDLTYVSECWEVVELRCQSHSSVSGPFV